MADNIQLSMEQVAFEELENEISNVMDQLKDHQSLERFRLEYEKLHRSMKTSHENEKKLLKKFKELNKDIQSNANKVGGAIKMTQEDQNTVQYLKSEVARTQQVLELSKEREDKNKQRSDNAHAEIKFLKTIMDSSVFSATEIKKQVAELEKDTVNLAKQRDEKTSDLQNQKMELALLTEKHQKIESDRMDLETEFKGFKKQLIEVTEKVIKDNDRKNKIVEELDTIKKNYEQSCREFENLVEEKKNLFNENQQLQIKLEEKEGMHKQLLQKIKNKKQDIQNIKLVMDEELESTEMLQTQRVQLHQQIQQQRNQLNILLQKNSQHDKMVQTLKSTILRLQDNYYEIQQMKEIAKNSISHIEKEVMDSRKYAKEDRAIVDELRYMREQMNKELIRYEDINKKQADDLNQKEKLIEEKQQDTDKLHKELQALEQQIQDLEKEKQKYGQQAAQANQKYFHSLEDIKLKDNLISEFQKKNLETEQKLKQQQAMYEAVRSDRNLYSKQLTETQDEIAEIKRRYKIVNHQISQLKEEIDAKEVSLAKENFEHKKKDKMIEEQSRVLEKFKKDIDQKEEGIKNLKGEIDKLDCVMKESERKRQKLKDEYESIVSERDILGTQLIRRNDESALLYEKIKIQQATLSKGEAAYRERLGDIELLNIKIRDLIREKRLIRKKAKMAPVLVDEIDSFKENLIEEKLKTKALSQELENPMNQERYRKLDGTDPDSYEMSSKIQSLQRRLIAKTEDVVEKEVILQQKEKNIQELREMLRRHPGIHEAKIISRCQQTLKQKTRQMKAQAAELNMYQAQLNEFKFDRERLSKDIQEINRKFNEQKRRIQIEKEYEEQMEREDQGDIQQDQQLA